MVKPFLLSISLCLLLFNACLARRPQQSQFNECQLNSLNALEPDHRVESEAGLTESWNANHPELRCAGVAVVKRTIQPRGLHLPSYSNSPQLHFIIHGRGVLGTAIPGCAETFEKPQSQSRQGGRSQQDRHQKVRHFREGDIIAIPAGIPYWTYNNGDSPLVAITLLDTTNLENQLDRNPRRFYLAGNPEEEHPESQKGRQQHRGGRKHGQQHQGGNNVLSGFDPQMLAEAFKIDEETARKLQSQEDQRNQIVKVREGLSIISPHSQREEEEEQGRQTRQRHEREQGRHQRGQEEEEEEEEEEQDPQSRERHQREKGRREGQRRQRQEEEEQQEQERQRRRERGERSRKGRQQEEEEQEEEEERQQGRQQRERGKGRRQGRGQEEEQEQEQEGEGEEQETQARERYQREKGRREGQRRQRQEEEEEEEEEQRGQERQRRRERAEGSRKGRRQEEEEEEEEEKEQQGRQQRERGKGRRQGRGKEEEEEEQGQGQGQGEEEEEEQEQQSQCQGQKGQSRRQGQRGQSEEEEEEEEEGEKEQQRERRCRPQRQRQTRCEQRCEAQRGQGSENALEETLCSLKLHQNIGNPSHADLYNPRAGRISTINSLDLPILRLLQLSAERVVLYRNGIYAPHWNINANSIIYVTRGRGRVQVVNCQGNSVFNGELRMGQLLVVPQNFPVAKHAGSEGFEYVAFKTNDRAMISSLVGRTSVIRAIPAEVLANAFGIRQQQVSAIKYSRNEGVLVSPASQSQESYIV